MAAIVDVLKPILGGTANHAFLLLQDDSGNFIEIARGGPESAIGGSNDYGMTEGLLRRVW